MDLIDRGKLIDALDKHCDSVCVYSKKQRSVMCGACPLGTAFDVIEGLSSAEDERKERIRQYKKMTSAAAMDAQGIEIGLVDTDD